MQTKIRSTIIALVATFTVAVTVAPAAQGQVYRPDRKPQLCRDLKTIYEGSIDGAVQIDGNSDGQNPTDTQAEESDKAANDAHAAGQKAGCRWAS